MFFDSHLHTFVSPDSEMDPEDVIKTLQTKNLGTIFTEHADFVTPRRGRDLLAKDAPRGAAIDFFADFDVYPAGYSHLRCDSVLLGIEFGLTKYFLPLNKETADKNDFDFIIGSIHFVDGWDLYRDYFNQPYEDHYARYLEYALEMVEAYDFYDSFGHIEYVSRYSTLKEKNAFYESYKKEYDALLKTIAGQGKALEINTSSFGDDVMEANRLNICRRFCELGGRYVTIGSDAHHLASLGRHFDKAYKIAEEAGLTPVYYKERKAIPCK